MDQQQQSRWRPTRRQVGWVLLIVVVLNAAVLIGYRYADAEEKQPVQGQPIIPDTRPLLPGIVLVH